MVNPFCARSKDYSFMKPRRHRIKFDLREKAAYVKLARLGYSINIISKVFKRSTSVIHRVLKHHKITDLRKLPRGVREKAAQIQLSNIVRNGQLYRDWAIGLISELPEEEEPP
jgi:transposase